MLLISECHAGWTLFDRATIGQFAPSIIGSVPFAAFLLAAQVLRQVTASLFVVKDVLIDPFGVSNIKKVIE